MVQKQMLGNAARSKDKQRGRHLHRNLTLSTGKGWDLAKIPEHRKIEREMKTKLFAESFCGIHQRGFWIGFLQRLQARSSTSSEQPTVNSTSNPRFLAFWVRRGNAPETCFDSDLSPFGNARFNGKEIRAILRFSEKSYETKGYMMKESLFNTTACET